MFEQTFVQTQAQTRRPWTVVVSLSLQCVAVAILLLIPLLHPEALRMPEPPQPHLIRTWITQPPIPPQKANPRASTVSASAAPRAYVFVPPNVRPAIAQRIDVPTGNPELTAWQGPSAAAFSPPFSGAAPLPPPAAVQPPPVPRAAKTTVSGPLSVSQGVQGAMLLYAPHPAYPPLAKTARSQGTVKLEAIVATDGSIRNLRVVSGPPLLVNAALNAVKQWRYRPTLLNGVAVEVLTEIDINFSLEK